MVRVWSFANVAACRAVSKPAEMAAGLYDLRGVETHE